MELTIWEHSTLLFSIGCHGILLWRLWKEKLAGVYLYLTMFLGAETFQNVVLFPIRRDSNLYAWIFLFSSVLVWAAAYFVVLELYRRILEDYPAISRVGRKAVARCMGLALVVSAIYAIPDLRNTRGPFPLLRVYAIVERSTVLGLLLFLVLIQLFLFRYRVQLPRNRMVYATGYALYFGVGMAQDILSIGLGVQIVNAVVSLWIVIISGFILLAGAALLNQEGEVLPPVDAVSHHARLQQELANMNRMISRAARGSG